MNKYKEHQQFVVMWDCYGLECVIPIPLKRDQTFAILKGLEVPRMPNIMHLELRARYNSQRHYEIYIIGADDEITVKDIQTMFDADPQTAADTIRRIGHCYYSDRQQNHKIAIQ